MVSMSSSQCNNRGLNAASTTGGNLKSVDTHQPVVALDCLYPVTGQ